MSGRWTLVESSVSLCVVVGGDIYQRYAEHLRISFYKYFFPTTQQAHFFIIPGEEGWPNGTMYRWHRLLENMPDTEYVFLCDADMRFEATVGGEIISDGVTLTFHPGFVGSLAHDLPFESRPQSSCYVPLEDRTFYFCGGFAGGKTKEVKRFANEIVKRIDDDVSRGIVPMWHDESALNKVANMWPDKINILDPSYCYPDNDIYYRTCVWRKTYKRKLVALDKEPHERASR